MNNDLMHGILLKSLEELKKRTRLNYSKYDKKHAIQVLRDAISKADGICLVYRQAVHHDVHLEEFENQYCDFICMLDKKIYELSI